MCPFLLNQSSWLHNNYSIWGSIKSTICLPKLATAYQSYSAVDSVTIVHTSPHVHTHNINGLLMHSSVNLNSPLDEA